MLGAVGSKRVSEQSGLHIRTIEQYPEGSEAEAGAPGMSH
jgi:hypothetical protein